MKNHLEKFKTIFWDFDGTIKDSNKAKSDVFVELFNECEQDIIVKISEHHCENLGMSRFEKLPIYLTWSGKECTTEVIDDYASRFSNLVHSKVVNSMWVPGVLEYLIKHHRKQNFILITSTPQIEIKKIINELSIDCFFKRVHGYPCKKEDVIRNYFINSTIEANEGVVVGDSYVDFYAAEINKIEFVLRKTNENANVSLGKDCLGFYDLT